MRKDPQNKPAARLISAAPATSEVKFAEDIHKTSGPIEKDALRYSVGAALGILNSSLLSGR